MTSFAKERPQRSHALFLGYYREKRDELNVVVEGFKSKMIVYKGFTKSSESQSRNQLVIKHLRIELEKDLDFIDDKSSKLAAKIDGYLKRNQSLITKAFDEELTEIIEVNYLLLKEEASSFRLLL